MGAESVARDLDPQAPRKTPTRSAGHSVGDHRIVVQLPHCSHPVCLPVLLRLWRGKGTASPAFLATDMVSILAQSFPYRNIQSWHELRASQTGLITSYVLTQRKSTGKQSGQCVERHSPVVCSGL